jgi:hypothetical protein
MPLGEGTNDEGGRADDDRADAAIIVRRWSRGYPWKQWGKWTGKGRNGPRVRAYFHSQKIEFKIQSKGYVHVVLDDLPAHIRQQVPE